ncbi:KxYKxGKxW signal peptide domain-containing protein, partial [Pediococcus acidilactici]
MSKRKIWNVNEKKHYKMYKNGKQWFFAGMGIVAGLFGAGSTTIASADETPRGANLDLSKSKNLLATKTSATIPGSTSAANSQSTNSTHNSVTNSTSAAKQNAQTSASQAASKAGSASLSASLKAAQDASASQQKASQSQAAAKAASQQKASEKTVKQSTTSSTKAKPTSQTSTKGSQAASTTKQDTASANQAKSASQGSQSKTDPQSKASTDASNNQSSQSLSAVKSATDSAKQSRSLEAAKQSLSISQSMVDSMSKSTEKITSDSNDPEAPIKHGEIYNGTDGTKDLIPGKTDWRDHDDALTITAPPEIPGYILNMSQTVIHLLLYGKNAPSPQQRLDFQNAFKAYAKTAGSIDDLNAWIKNSDFYKQYLTGEDPESDLYSLQVQWYFDKHESELNLEGHDVETSVGNPLEPKDAVTSITNADGSHPNLDEDLPGLTWIGYINWNQHGDYDVMLSYYDANSLQTVTTPITVHVTSLINLDGKDGTTYEGYPKDIGDFVKDTILNGKGEHVDIADADLSWNMREDNWNHAKDYDITIQFKDTTGEIIETHVTIHVLKNQSEISGKDATYTVGQGPHLTVDDLQPSGRNADGSLASGFEADFSHVDWDHAGVYSVEISFTDKLTGGKVSTTVTVTVDDNYGSMSTSASISNKNDDDSRSASISDKNDSESTSTSNKHDDDSRSISTSISDKNDSESTSTSNKNDDDSRSISTSTSDKQDSESTSTSNKNDDDSRSISTSTSDKQDSESTSTSNKNDDDSRS